MPYVRVWIHLIWSTKNREPLIIPTLRPKLLSHMGDNATGKNIHLDAINCVADHVHALISLKQDQSIAKVAQLLKGESSHWINANNCCPVKFEWQEEYYAVSVGDTALETVREYIRNQESITARRVSPRSFKH